MTDTPRSASLVGDYDRDSHCYRSSYSRSQVLLQKKVLEIDLALRMPVVRVSHLIQLPMGPAIGELGRLFRPFLDDRIGAVERMTTPWAV